MFEPYLKNFYIRSNDSTHVKLLKVWTSNRWTRASND